MPKIVNALQLKNGAKAEYNKMGTITKPIQFLPKSEKDQAWAAHNIDWLELEGMKQLRRNAKRLLKNYKLANGIIDKRDYIMDNNDEYSDLVDVLTQEDESALQLKFYPIIPNIINVLLGEFSKRTDKILYRAVDDLSYNELLEEKRSMVEQVILAQAEQKMMMQLQQMGVEDQEQIQQAMSPENLRSLPEIEQFFKKDYKSMGEQWATHQHNIDEERFKLYELEASGFKDMLITDREFWHFKMNEDDYEIELWNPVLTFYHKSPDIRYISDSNWVGKVDLMTVPDVIDKYGYLMNEEQLTALENIYPVKSALYPMSGIQNDGSFYDATKSHAWNVNPPSLGMRQFTSVTERFLAAGDTVIDQILSESEDFQDYGRYDMLRVTNVYWKSQKRVGYVTEILEDGFPNQYIVSEDFKVTTKPEYNTTVVKVKDESTLVYGQHVEWIWINETWGGIKVGPNRPTFYGTEDTSGFEPMYLECKPLKFQFKGDYTLYGCKLPVEGAVFSDRNTISTSMVDKLKPYQIGFNLVNNQISDILIDELGTVIVLDHNTLPQASAGEDWGRHNYSKAYVAMKNFSMLPLDTSMANTESALNFQHFQKLDMEQTNRLMSRVQLANYFKQMAFEAIGITPQRMGQQISQSMTATGIETALNMSFSQTEMYFVQHSEYLMPRVHKMRTDLAQYYHSNNPSVRLSYVTSLDERINFEMNGTDLLLRDLNVFITSRVNHRELLEKIRGLAVENNTAGASIYDLANIVKAESIAEVSHVLKSIEEKTNAIRQQEQQAEQELQQYIQEQENLRLEQQQMFEAEQNERDRQNDLQVAQVRAASYTGQSDVNENKQSDYIDTLEYLDKKEMNSQKMQLERERDLRKNAIEQRMASLKEKELQVRERIANKQLQVAKENKNKYDSKKK